MNEREILEQSIKEHKEAIGNAEKELAAINEPKLRHGELRIWTGGGHNGPFIVDLSDDECHCIWQDGDLRNRKNEKHILDSSTVISHIFDDLKRNSEDLDEFETGYLDGSCSDRVRVRIKNRYFDHIELKVESSHFTEKLPKFIEIHQKLGQLIATAIRRRQGAKWQ